LTSQINYKKNNPDKIIITHYSKLKYRRSEDNEWGEMDTWGEIDSTSIYSIRKDKSEISFQCEKGTTEKSHEGFQISDIAVVFNSDDKTEIIVRFFSKIGHGAKTRLEGEKVIVANFLDPDMTSPDRWSGANELCDLFVNEQKFIIKK